MSDICTVVLTGNLTRDPETIQTKGDATLVKFGLAVGQRSGGEDVSSFFDVTTFGKTAEFVEKYLSKGSRVELSGRLQQDRWEKDGEKRSKVIVIANQLNSPKPTETNGDGNVTPATVADQDEIPF